MQASNQEPIEYRNLDTLRIHLAAISAARKIGRRADDVWKGLPWKKFQTQVFRLQRAIFKAQKNDNKGKVKRLQRLLLQSRAAQALAVKLVTQGNSGKKTPGVDGKTALNTKERLILCQRLNRHWHKWNHNNWKPRNLVALHRPCHQAQPVHRKCIKDGLERRKAIKSPEPCEVKVSRTVRRRGAR